MVVGVGVGVVGVGVSDLLGVSKSFCLSFK